MRNDGRDVIRVGATQNDEMCNFYIMYWVEGNELVEDAYCFTDGPPSWSWKQHDGIDVDDVPYNASLVPGTDVMIYSRELLYGDTTEERFNKASVENIILEIFLPTISSLVTSPPAASVHVCINNIHRSFF